MRSTFINGVSERRTALRYPLRLPVIFSWQDERGKNHGCDGYCRDLGSRGIYISAGLVPPIGVTVEMDVLLPRLQLSARPSEIHAIGRVVRSEHASGFATMNHTTVLRETESQKPGEEVSMPQGSRLDEPDGEHEATAGQVSGECSRDASMNQPESDDLNGPRC